MSCQERRIDRRINVDYFLEKGGDGPWIKEKDQLVLNKHK